MGHVIRALVATLLLLATSVGGAFYVGQRRLTSYASQPFQDEGKAPFIRVKIPKGSNARQVGTLLEKEGVVRSGKQFYWFVRLIQKSDHLLRPGEYDLKPTMTPLEVMQKIVKGDVVTYKLTIPEGSNLKDIARIIAASGLAVEEEVTKVVHDVDFARSLGVPDAQDTLEGYLFPDTYRFPSGTPVKEMLKVMNAKLQQVVTPEIIAKGKALNLNPHEILTLASIVEKETGAPQERPQIASVFHNRLKKGMKLQTDPTVIYGIPDYEGNISKADLERVHPYNTYVIPALPPGPIASPGADAIKAAVVPADTKYLFFVSMNNGTHIFCQTYQCHTENVKKWQVDFFKVAKKG